jgi:alpha-1,6-mannosyltransferase
VTSSTVILLWIGALVCAGAIHLALAWRMARRPPGGADSASLRQLKIIVVAAVLMRVPFLFLDPALSDDVWRNIWDGRVQVSGINPYLCSPEDDRLAALRDDLVRPRINHPQYRTIYPPFGQMTSATAAALSRMTGLPELMAWKLLVAAIELAGLWLLGVELARKGQASWLALWAFSPLAIFEFAGGGHIDGVSLGLTGAAAALWMRHRATGAGALFATAVMTKFLPLPVAVGFIGQKNARRAGLAAIAVAALVTLPYLPAGPQIVEQLGVYAGHWEFNGVLNRWLYVDAWGHGLSAAATALGVTPPWSGHEKALGRIVAWSAIFLAGAVAARRGTDPFLVARRTLAAFLAAQPTLYPWYLANLLPLLCIAPSWSLAAWLAASPLTYEVMYTKSSTGTWSENLLLQNVVFGVASTLFILEYLAGRRKDA